MTEYNNEEGSSSRQAKLTLAQTRGKKAKKKMILYNGGGASPHIVKTRKGFLIGAKFLLK